MGKLNIELKPGDVLHCTSDKILARAIQFFTKSRISHTATVVDIWGKLFIVDSQRDGTNPRPLKEWIEKYSYKYKIHRPLEIDIVKYHIKVASKIGFTPYDFASLLIYQPWYQITGKWIGKTNKESDKKMYCSEFVAWLNDLPEYWRLSPNQVFEEMEKRPDKWELLLNE
jgi:hypothetical protein